MVALLARFLDLGDAASQVVSGVRGPMCIGRALDRAGRFARRRAGDVQRVVRTASLAQEVLHLVLEHVPHHLDLRAPHPADPADVVAAREQEEAIIRGWIEQYFQQQAMEL